MHGAARDEAEGLPPAPVEAVAELVQVAGHVLLAHPSGGTQEPRLEVREERVALGLRLLDLTELVAQSSAPRLPLRRLVCSAPAP